MTILNSEKVKSIIAEIKLANNKKLLDLISNIVVKQNDVGFAIDVTEITKKAAENARDQAIELLGKIVGIGKITIVLTANNLKEQIKKPPKYFIEGAKKIILVASGKGGVGKSTVAALLAQQLRDQCYQVGLVDADLYGPSIPQIFGTHEKPKIEDKMMVPIRIQGIQINSIGFLIDSNSALAWRGPMASKAIYQLLLLTKWQNVDYLIIDMPPGTGDIHLSILENYHLDSVIIVTTPQKISAIDVRKAIDLYQKFDLKILGIIENMSYYLGELHKRISIFSGNEGENLAIFYNVPLITKLPILPSLAKACDEGKNLSNILQIPLKKILG